jgi:HPC2 and ubinuclein domain
MELGEATRGSSPNSDLSDAPTSDMEATSAAYSRQHSSPHTGNDHPLQFNGSAQAGVTNNASASNAGGTPATAAPRQATQAPTSAPVKRKPRAKKESLPADGDKASEKPKTRKPRSDKGMTKPQKKKPKLEPAPDNTKVCTPNLTQPSITGAIKFQPQVPGSTNTPPHPQIEARPISQNGFTRTPGVYESPKPNYNPPVLNDSPTTSSNMYDPVRAMTVQRPSTATSQPMYQQTYNIQSQPQSPFRPSPSPAISSMMNPPEPWRTSAPIQYRPEAQSKLLEPMPLPAPHQQLPSSTVIDLDSPPPARESPKLNEVSKKSPSVKESSPAPEKKQRAKEQPPPLPQGSGLLSSTLFGGSSSDAPTSTDKIPNIILHIDLKGKTNNIINFAQMAEEKYGFAALHPRLAAQKERLARVAAVGAALERSASGSRMGGTSAGESGDDDGSVDIDRDSADDGDALMGGMNNTDGAGNSGTDGPTAKRRRRKKIEEYDQDDPFVDDSELVWESQAAASKDGFFVYCGPLVPEGEKATVERYVECMMILRDLLTISTGPMVPSSVVAAEDVEVVWAPGAAEVQLVSTGPTREAAGLLDLAHGVATLPESRGLPRQAEKIWRERKQRGRRWP